MIWLLGRKLFYIVLMCFDFIFILFCFDCIGIVYCVFGLLFDYGCNIFDVQQFGDEESGCFFLCVYFDCDVSLLLEIVYVVMVKFVEGFGMDWQLYDGCCCVCLLVLVSKQGYCFNDLLFCVYSGQLKVDIVVVVFNYVDFVLLVVFYQVLFYYLLVIVDMCVVQEQQIIDLVECECIDLVVLVCYMQILLFMLCCVLVGCVINIYYSFLFSFKGVQLYYQVYVCGVKIIGVIVYYVIEDLDEGLIIEQDVVCVDYVMVLCELVWLGSDIELLVLVCVVCCYVEYCILFNGYCMVVFW